MSHRQHFIARLSQATTLSLMFWLVASEAVGQTVGNCLPSVAVARLDANNVRTSVLANGALFDFGHPRTRYEVPAGGNRSSILGAHFLLSGLMDGEVAGVIGYYSVDNQLFAGPVFPGVNSPPNCDEFDRIYKIRRDDVVAYETDGTTTSDLREWPTGLGAPTLDAAGNRIVLTSDGSLSHVDQAGIVISEEELSFTERLARKIDLGAGERPEILGDQMLWWIMNDLGSSDRPYVNTQPIGLEIHATAFAFNVPGAIGNTTFYRYRVLHKGAKPIEKAYIGMFFDADLGYSDDDYVGVDTTLGLGFTYNADDEDEANRNGYGPAPPAVGVDFFQGPLVDSDGLDNDRDGTVDETDERLQMTSFIRAVLFGGPYEGDINTAEEGYNVMRGLWKDGLPMTVGGIGRDFSTERTTFQFSGAPERGEFWSQINSDGLGTSLEPKDTRFFVSSGPFDFAPGQEQEIVFGIVWSRGSDHLDSVRQLKEDDALAQALFDIGFVVPRPPDAPRVTATPLDGKVILEWTYEPTDNNYLESYYAIDPLLSPDVTDNDYEFEGYRVIQYESPRDQVGSVLATYDVPNGITRVIGGAELTYVAAEGTDSGIQHSHVVDGLTNYQTYFFGVQAYAYNEGSGSKVYNGPVRRVEIVPARVGNRSMGTTLAANVDDEVPLDRLYEGARDEQVSVEVVNPASVTGHEYTIDIVDYGGTLTYNVVDKSTGQVAYDGSEYVQLHDRSPIARLGDTPSQIVVDGLGITVWAATHCSDRVYLNPSGAVDGLFPPSRPLQREVFVGPLGNDPDIPAPGTVVRFYSRTQESVAGMTAFFDSVDVDGDDIYEWLFSADLIGDFDHDGTADTMRAVTEVSGPGGANPCPGGGEEVGCTRGERIVVDPFLNSTNTWTIPSFFNQSFSTLPYFTPQTYEIRFTDEAALAWDLFRSRAMIEVPFEIWDIGDVLPGEPNDAGDDLQMVPVYFSDERGQCEWSWSEVDFGDGFGMSDRIYAYYLAPSVRYDDFYDEASSAVVRPVRDGDSFVISTDQLAARSGIRGAVELDEIGIVPNPYKGASAYEVRRGVDEVRFTNMPPQATIRVFDLAGSLIRRLDKNSPEAYFPWDLTTDEGLPIASGIYFVHVQVPEVGERALKFAVVRKGTRVPTF